MINIRKCAPAAAGSAALLHWRRSSARREMLRQNAISEARRLCLDVLELAPGQLDALTLLYQIYQTQGPASAAEALLRRIVQLYPNTFWATNDLTLMLLSKGAIIEAEHHARNAIRVAPDNPQSHNLMGIVMTEANRPGRRCHSADAGLTGRCDRRSSQTLPD
jgi:Tfp pilus assembly protein PilF